MDQQPNENEQSPARPPQGAPQGQHQGGSVPRTEHGPAARQDVPDYGQSTQFPGYQNYGSHPYGAGGYGAGSYGNQSYGQYSGGTYYPGEEYPATAYYAAHYPADQGYPTHSGYTPQQGYPTQSGYAPRQGYPTQSGYGRQQGYPIQQGKRRSTALMTVAAIVAGALIGGGGVAAFAAVDHHNSSGSGTTAAQAPNGQSNGNGNGAGNGSGNGSGNGTSTSSAAKATATQQVGIVDIDTVVDYGEGEAAGTGMVIASDGYVLTNNHVVDDSTQIKVTVISTGKTYTAKVVGTDPTDDIAVIKLADANNLQLARLGNSSSAKVGDAITGVGNAGGVGGTPSAAAGTIVALNQSITASDSDGSNAENLTGLIQVNAQIQAGDSGGPLYNASDAIIGIDTAAETSRSSGSTVAGYAIPINTALSLAKRITSGESSATIHQGYPAFLGVVLSDTSGTTVGKVMSGGPADKAGIAAGDTITAVGNTSVSTSTDLKSALQQYKPGSQVSVTWTTAAGTTQSATVTLVAGPAD